MKIGGSNQNVSASKNPGAGKDVDLYPPPGKNVNPNPKGKDVDLYAAPKKKVTFADQVEVREFNSGTPYKPGELSPPVMKKMSDPFNRKEAGTKGAADPAAAHTPGQDSPLSLLHSNPQSLPEDQPALTHNAPEGVGKMMPLSTGQKQAIGGIALAALGVIGLGGAVIGTEGDLS
jgi:hypothetical protein